MAGASDMLAGEMARFQDDDRQLIEIIQRNSLRMIRLLDDVLLLGRIDRQELGLDPQLCSLEALVKEQVRHFGLLAEEREVRFDLADELEDVMIHADESRLSRILYSLVGNASRFVKVGGTVAVTTRLEGDLRVLRVEDDGPGIQAGEGEQVFQRFFRGTRGSDAHGGAGLGLAIAYELALAMGGRLELTQVEPAGCRFELRLPGAVEGLE